MNSTDFKKRRLLLVGGAGYIGSHTALALSQAGHEVVVVDNLSNSSQEYLDHLSKFCVSQYFVADCRDTRRMTEIMDTVAPDAVLHFAAYKSLPESVTNPASYYKHNINALWGILDAMTNLGLRKIVFSSSAAVYGEPQFLPITENHPRTPGNPYGRTKAMCEDILEDLSKAGKIDAVALRYFNPIGADPEGRIGEVNKKAGNVAPLIVQAAIDKKPFSITGNNFPTPDGTGLRDYIHVMDLAQAHLNSLNFILETNNYHVFNVGIGKSHSVKELVHEFEKTSKTKITTTEAPKRPADLAEVWADSQKIQTHLGWVPSHTLEDMCAHQWYWALKMDKGKGY